MAVSERYVDPAGGNDYIGATFTDGVYTDSTKNLNKTNAFTASKAGHWLYLTGTNITSGYYKIATRTDASNVILATDAGSDSTAVTCTQADGSSSLPFHSVQGALDLTTRNSTDGDRINVKAGTADTLSAALNLTTYGTPTDAAQLIIQGYTSSAGDGGIGEINGGGSYGICTTSATYTNFVDLKVGNCGSADVLDFGANSHAINCEIHTSSGFGVDSGSSTIVLGCWFHDLTGTQAVDTGTYSRVLYSFFDVSVTTSVIDSAAGVVVAGNIVDLSGADTSVIGIDASSTMTVLHNTVYCGNANTARGIYVNSGSVVVLNNVVEGWSGTGGDGIETAGYNSFVGANAAYNCAAAYTLTAAKLNYAIAPNDTLSGSPFANAGSNDFSIADSQTNVTEDAYPASFRGL